jgi:hypothetical protein
MSDSSDADRHPFSEPASVAGADIRYKWDHGYDALLDAVHGRDVARDSRLLENAEPVRPQPE